MKKLVVCGCSWSSKDPAYPNTEFGYFVAKHFGWEYVNIGRVGCDNYGIRLQIDYAIKELKADYIIVNWTTACRFIWNAHGKKYSPTKGLKQLDYTVDNFFTNPESHPAFNDDDFEPTLQAQSIYGMITFEHLRDMPEDDPLGLTLSYAEALKAWPEIAMHLNEKQFYAFRSYYLHMYDDDLEAHKQYHFMESAVSQMERNNVKFIFCPNTFSFMQTVQMMAQETWDYEKHERQIYDEMYNEWEFVPEESLEMIGIAQGLNWDKELMDDPVNHPNHNHVHHLSAESQERWATEVAIPRFEKLIR